MRKKKNSNGAGKKPAAESPYGSLFTYLSMIATSAGMADDVKAASDLLIFFKDFMSKNCRGVCVNPADNSLYMCMDFTGAVIVSIPIPGKPMNFFPISDPHPEALRHVPPASEDPQEQKQAPSPAKDSKGPHKGPAHLLRPPAPHKDPRHPQRKPDAPGQYPQPPGVSSVFGG